MTMARGPFTLTLRRCLRLAALPTAIVALLAFYGARQQANALGTAAAAEPWLLLPLLGAAALCTLTTAAFWPLFAHGRPGADVVRRLHPRRLQGTGRAIAGALVAQALLTAAVLLPLLPALGAPATASTFVVASANGGVLLPADGSTNELRFTIAGGEDVTAVRLRPLAGFPADGLVPTRLRLIGDSGPLSEATVAVDDSLQAFEVRFPAQRVATLRLVREGGTVPLLFPPGSVSAQTAEVHASWTNALLLVVVLLLPSLLALGLGCLCGRSAALPTTATVVGAMLFVATVGELGPAAPALRAVLRGEWLLGGGAFGGAFGGTIFQASLPTLLVGCAAMFVASRVQPWRRR